jgi:hypothetical protein
VLFAVSGLLFVVASLNLGQRGAGAPDGKRIAAIMPGVMPEARSAQGYVTLLLSFFDVLRRRVPSR